MISSSPLVMMIQLEHAIQTHIIDTLSNDEKNKVSIVRDSIERCGPLGGTL